MAMFHTIHTITALAIVAIFIISVALIEIATHNMFVAVILSITNIIGATFAPTAAFAYTDNPLVFTAFVLGLVGNIALTIIVVTFFYEVLSSIDVDQWVAKQKAKRLKNHAIITPINGISIRLARKLKENKIQAVLMDNERRKVKKALHEGLLALNQDATYDDSLKKGRIDSAFVVFSLYENDVSNAFVSIAAKKQNEKCSVISRIKTLDDIPKLERAGTKRVIMPEAAIGDEIAGFIVGKL